MGSMGYSNPIVRIYRLEYVRHGGDGLFKDSGTNVLLNIFGGPAVNAARGIASQVINATTG